jgi:hypothetical protein
MMRCLIALTVTGLLPVVPAPADASPAPAVDLAAGETVGTGAVPPPAPRREIGILTSASDEDPGWSRLSPKAARSPSATASYSGGDGGVLFTVGVAGRVAFPTGGVDNHSPDLGVPGATVLPEHMRYDKLFDPGFGGTVETSLLFETDRNTNGSYGVQKGIGVYLAAQVDYFDGSRVSYDTGNVLHPDRLTTMSGFVGFKGVAAIDDSFFTDFRVGAGMIHFNTVDAELTSPGLPGSSFVLFQSTWQFAAEAKLHAGYRAGPLSLGVGGGVRMNTGLEAGNDPLSTWLDPKTMWIFDVELGLELGF